MTDLNELMRQAQKMQDQFKQAQEDLSNLVWKVNPARDWWSLSLMVGMTWSLSALMTQL